MFCTLVMAGCKTLRSMPDLPPPPPPLFVPSSQTHSGQYALSVWVAFSIKSWTRKIKWSRTKSGASLVSGLGCNSTLGLLLPPLHCLDHRDLLGFLLFIPGFKLQPGTRKNGRFNLRQKHRNQEKKKRKTQKATLICRRIMKSVNLKSWTCFQWSSGQYHRWWDSFHYQWSWIFLSSLAPKEEGW